MKCLWPPPSTVNSVQELVNTTHVHNSIVLHVMTHAEDMKVVLRMFDHRILPACRNVLKGVQDFTIAANFTYEPLLTTKAAAVHMRGGKLDYLPKERGQLSFSNLQQKKKRQDNGLANKFAGFLCFGISASDAVSSLQISAHPSAGVLSGNLQHVSSSL